jgi:hypothetical protein
MILLNLPISNFFFIPLSFYTSTRSNVSQKGLTEASVAAPGDQRDRYTFPAFPLFHWGQSFPPNRLADVIRGLGGCSAHWTPNGLPNGLEGSPLAADSRWIPAMTGCHRLAFSHQSISRQPTHAHQFVRIQSGFLPRSSLYDDCCDPSIPRLLQMLGRSSTIHVTRRNFDISSLNPLNLHTSLPLPELRLALFPFMSNRPSAYLTTDLFSDHLTRYLFLPFRDPDPS